MIDDNGVREVDKAREAMSLVKNIMTRVEVENPDMEVDVRATLMDKLEELRGLLARVIDGR